MKTGLFVVDDATIVAPSILPTLGVDYAIVTPSYHDDYQYPNDVEWRLDWITRGKHTLPVKGDQGKPRYFVRYAPSERPLLVENALYFNAEGLDMGIIAPIRKFFEKNSQVIEFCDMIEPEHRFFVPLVSVTGDPETIKYFQQHITKLKSVGPTMPCVIHVASEINLQVLQTFYKKVLHTTVEEYCYRTGTWNNDMQILKEFHRLEEEMSPKKHYGIHKKVKTPLVPVDSRVIATGVVTAGTLSIREAPSITAKAKGVLNCGAEVEFIGFQETYLGSKFGQLPDGTWIATFMNKVSYVDITPIVSE